MNLCSGLHTSTWEQPKSSKLSPRIGHTMPPNPSQPIYASFPSDLLTHGAGVAIFHLATARVVVCYHTRDGYYFLPKGRRNVGEGSMEAAEREGFEESGYRNRVLAVVMGHRQTFADREEGDNGAVDIKGRQSRRKDVFVTEPVWMQLLPVSRRSQYLLFWYIAETVPEEVEKSYPLPGTPGYSRIYRPPEPIPRDMTVTERIAQDTGLDGKVYEPIRHEGTGINEEEALYESCLLPVEEARRKLKGSVMEDVVRRGWEGILRRREMEEEMEKEAG